MKTAKAQSTTATTHLQTKKQAQPFFQKSGGGSVLTNEQTPTPFFSAKPTIQTKLTVGQPGDKYEQEADHMADTVVQKLSKPDAPAVQKKQHSAQPVTTAAPLVQQQTAEEEINPERKLEAEANEMLQKKPVFESAGQPEDDPDIQRACTCCREEEKVQAKSERITNPGGIENRLNSTKGSGSPLPVDTRSSMEQAFGSDFSGVRVHTGSDAVRMNEELGAQAFTHGSDIYFNQGKYDPSSRSGKHLLVHELTHTVQQGGSSLHTKKQSGKPEGGSLKTDAPNIQAFGIPFTDYETDFSVEGIKNAANIAKDAVVDSAGWVKDKVEEGLDWIFDKISSLVSSGMTWLREQWNSIQSFASSGFEALKNSFASITGLILSPFSFIASAITSMDAESLSAAWASFSGVVSGIWEGFKSFTNGILQQITDIWEGINGFATSLFDEISGITQNYLFKKLPDAVQEVIFSLINQVRKLWNGINDGWNTLFNEIKTWIDAALISVERFVLQVTSFAINVIIEGIRQFGELVLFFQDLFANPQKYLEILAEKSVAALSGVENYFSGIVNQYFGEDKKTEPTNAISGTIQKQPEKDTSAEVKNSASWGQIGSGVWKMMGNKWNEFKSNPLSVVTGLLLDLFFPIYGNIKDVIQLYDDIKKIVTEPLSAGSLKEFWTSLLLILDIPILIYKTVVSILMRSLMVPLIVASFIPHPLVKAIAAAVGYGLLGAFVEAELLNIGHKLLLLKTGATTKEQKEEAYNRIADSFIAFAMTAAIMLIMLILHFMANVIKGVYNFVKGKMFPVDKVPVEGKGGGTLGEGKGNGAPEQGKGSKPGETTKLEGEVASRDGQRSIKVTEKGKIWICASPCEDIRLKYETQIKDNPNFNERIKTLEEGYSDLPPEQKPVRDAQIKQLEQELADIKLAQEGGGRAPKEVKWPPAPPKGDKPPITAPDAAEWRYQRYVYEKFQEGATPEKVLPPDEWMRRYFDPTAEGGRPGRPGGAEQVAAKKALAAEGIKIVENVELGGRYPDGVDPKPNPAGGKNYFEVGKMLESGIPEARERVKIADEIKAMGANDSVTFVDKADVSKRVTYAKGSTPENPTSRTFKPGKE